MNDQKMKTGAICYDGALANGITPLEKYHLLTQYMILW